MDLTTLPDDALVGVLGYLDTRQLLKCRGVCRRLRDAALHPDLWRKRSLISGSNHSDRKLVRAILRLAPCLASLEVSRAKDDLWTTLMSTSCATSKVKFSINPDDAAFTALSISRQASLGRLKALTVELSGEPASPATPSLGRSLCALLLQICHTEGLEELYLREYLYRSERDALVKCCEGLECATTPAPVSASLERLAFVGSCYHFRDLLLQWHAETLEEVCCPFASARLAPLLSSMPRLRQLACAPFEGMRALQQCPALRSLLLVVSDQLPPEDVSYLTDAACTQLEHLDLTFYKVESVPSVMSLLLCLGGATLRSLTLKFRVEPRPSLYQEPLTGVLHQLPLLRLLDLNSEPTPALLRALDGRALPELRQLRVRLQNDYSLGCPHHFIESEEVRGLMRRYPRLHVVMKDVRFGKGCEAAFCRDAGNLLDYSRCVLYSHEAAARCDVSHRGYGGDELWPCVAFHVATA